MEQPLLDEQRAAIAATAKPTKTKKTAAPRGLYWCLTINNYPDLTWRDEFTQLEPRLVYWVAGKEIGENGNKHLQAFIAFKNRTVFTAVVAAFPHAHIEPKVKKSTPAQAADYCKKDGDWIEWGVLPAAQNEAGGNANAEKWALVKQQAQAGNLDEIDAEIFVKHYSTLKKIKSDAKNRIIPKNLDWIDNCPPNEWLYGPTGTGMHLNYNLI